MNSRLLPLLPLLLALVGLPLALQLVPPNGFYGIRTEQTLASADIWYRSNLYGGLAAVVFGVLGTAFVAMVVRRASMTETAKAGVAVLTTIVVAAAMTLAGLLAL